MVVAARDPQRCAPQKSTESAGVQRCRAKMKQGLVTVKRKTTHHSVELKDTEEKRPADTEGISLQIMVCGVQKQGSRKKHERNTHNEDKRHAQRPHKEHHDPARHHNHPSHTQENSKAARAAQKPPEKAEPSELDEQDAVGGQTSDSGHPGGVH